MAGTIIQAVPVYRIDFSEVVGGETERRVLTPWPIDVSRYTQGTLLVRLHQGMPNPMVDSPLDTRQVFGR